LTRTTELRGRPFTCEMTIRWAGFAPWFDFKCVLSISLFYWKISNAWVIWCNSAKGHRPPSMSEGRLATDSRPADWENPAVVGINKRKPHSTLRSFTDPLQAFQHYRLASEHRTSPRQICLNGNDWGFRLFPRPRDVPSDFSTVDFDSSEWDTAS